MSRPLFDFGIVSVEYEAGEVFDEWVVTFRPSPAFVLGPFPGDRIRLSVARPLDRLECAICQKPMAGLRGDDYFTVTGNRQVNVHKECVDR